MGRHSKEKQAATSRIDDLRREAIEEFFGLKVSAQKHIEWSLNSIKPCSFCSVDETGNHKPGRSKDEQGRCAFCHGSTVVPDAQQRNWAVEEVISRIAPVPKAVELVDKTEDLEASEQELRALTDADFNQRLALLDYSDGSKPEAN